MYCICLITSWSLFVVFFLGPPQITFALNVVAVIGSNVLLTCKVASNPPANITWYYENSVIVAAQNQTHGPRPLVNGSLEIVEALSGDSGSYICEASNPFASTNATVTLRITGNETNVVCCLGRQCSSNIQVNAKVVYI